MITKSTITITDDGNHMRIEISHDPKPTGQLETWNKAAQTAEIMMLLFHAETERAGMKPIIDARKNWDTDETFITRRDKEEGEDE